MKFILRREAKIYFISLQRLNQKKTPAKTQVTSDRECEYRRYYVLHEAQGTLGKSISVHVIKRSILSREKTL